MHLCLQRNLTELAVDSENNVWAADWPCCSQRFLRHVMLQRHVQVLRVCRGQMYVGAFLRQDPPEDQERQSEREQSSTLMSEQKLYKVGTLAKVENLVRHDKIEGAQLLLYGHQRIRRLEMVRSCVVHVLAVVTAWRAGQKEHLVRHDNIEGAQLLLYGHQRIRRLKMVRFFSACINHG